MTVSSRLGVGRRSIAGSAAVLLAGVYSSGCSGDGFSSDAAEVETGTTQTALIAGSGWAGGHGVAVGRLGHRCSPTGAHACAAGDRKAQLICDASGVWQANGSCSAGNECDARPGAGAGSCQPVIPECRHDDDWDDEEGHGRWREWNRWTPRSCDFEPCIDERHHVRWHRVCTDGCALGETRCSGNGVQTCDSRGQWSAGVPCQYVCDAGTGTCTGVCTPEETRCSGNGVQTCDASGQWGAVVACVDQACDGATGACTGVCTPGAMQCSSGNGPADGVQTRDASGQWGKAVPCVNQTCDRATATCIGVCTEGSTQCYGNGIQTCGPDGQWGDAVACQYACDPVMGACAGVCTPGATRCSGNGVQTCDAAGQWGPAVVCDAGAPTCANGACVPTLPACLQPSYSIPLMGSACTQTGGDSWTGCGPSELSCVNVSGTADVELSYDANMALQAKITGALVGTYSLSLSADAAGWTASSGTPGVSPYVAFTVTCALDVAMIDVEMPQSRIGICSYSGPDVFQGAIGFL